MRKRLALILLAAASSVPVSAQNSKPAPDQTAATKAWADFATPNENHHRLDPLVGSWNIHITFWPAQNAAAQESDGTAEIRWILGGRYLEQRQDCPVLGRLMSGLGYTGFDNIRRRYVTTWMDTFGTSILETSGTFDFKDKTLRTEGAFDDVPTQKPLRYEDALKIVGRDEFIYEARTSRPADPRMHLVMRIVYRRRP